MTERASKFGIIVDEFAISSINFSKNFQNAIEAKQMAQQKAEKAAYQVIGAHQEMKSAIINAEADAMTIELIGKTAKNNPGRPHSSIKSLIYHMINSF